MSWFLTARSSTARPQPITPTIARAATSTAQYITVRAFLPPPQSDTSTLSSSSFDNAEACRSFSNPFHRMLAASDHVACRGLFGLFRRYSCHRHHNCYSCLRFFHRNRFTTMRPSYVHSPGVFSCCHHHCQPFHPLRTAASDHVACRGLFGLLLRRASPPYQLASSHHATTPKQTTYFHLSRIYHHMQAITPKLAPLRPPLPCQSPTLLTCYTRRFVSAYIIVITTAIFVCHTTSSSVRSFFTACLAAFVLSCDDLATRCCLASVVQDQLPCSSHFSCSFFFTVPLLLFDHSLLLYVTYQTSAPSTVIHAL